MAVIQGIWRKKAQKGPVEKVEFDTKINSQLNLMLLPGLNHQCLWELIFKER